MAEINGAGIDGAGTNGGGAGLAALDAAWRAAINSARAKSMRLFELRSTVGLARLLTARGEPSTAREMLGPIHDSFREGADSFDLIEARRLLADLAI
jgi:hypothetical protein